MTVGKITAGILGFVFLFSVAAVAQTATGSISGLVEDESGGVIPGVTVTVTNVDTGISSSLPTNASGRYHVPTLNPGHYEVQAQMTGFETALRRGLRLTVGSELVINLVLNVGQVTQTTVVTAESPIVETATSSLSGLVDDKTIRDLPLNGRSFDQLIALQASSPRFRARSSGMVSGISEKYSVNGARTVSNMFLIDGTEMLSGSATNTEPGGALGINMGVDAVQEFVVLSGNYSAAYGKRGGGIINIATRSGSNQFHGSAFEFLRNSALDARNFFDKNPQPPPFKRNSFGGALGGPIRKDSSFFFGNYEGLRQGIGLTNIATVPDENARQGLLPDLANPGQFVRVQVSPAVQPYLAALFPLPNGRNLGDGSALFHSSPQQIVSQDFFLIRFDQKLSDKDSFFARYNLTQGDQTVPEQIPLFAEFNRSRDQVLTVEGKRAYATTVNLIRAGFSRGNLSSDSNALVSIDPSLRFVTTANHVGQLAYAIGTSTVGSQGVFSRAGPGNSQDRSYIINQFDLADQVYHYRGPHSLQFGVHLQRTQYNIRHTSSAVRGVFEYDSLANLLQGRFTRFQGPPPTAGAFDPTKAYRRTYFSSFVQDDYKVLRNLTLNLGLHYELMTVPIEASGNRISNYHYQFVNGLRVLDSLPTLGSPYFRGSHKNFAPRVGFAWDPFSDGKLAVRGGFGIFYDQIEAEWRHGIVSNLPFDSRATVTNPPFPLAFSGGEGSRALPAPVALDTNLPVSTVVQYSFGIQRQVTSSSVFNIFYVGSRSTHLTRNMEGNPAAPQILPGGIFFYPAGARRLNPDLSSTSFLQSDANGFYNSLQLEFIQRVSHGVRYKVSYAHAKNMDDASTFTSALATGSAKGTENPFDRRTDLGLSSFDVRDNFVTNITYEVPWSNLSGFAGKLMGGWQLGGIVSLSAGNPFSALAGSNRSRDLSTDIVGDRPNLRAGASNNPTKGGTTAGCPGLASGQKLGGTDRYFDPCAFELAPAGFYGNLGRNTLIGPGFANVDFTLAKMTSVNERFKVDFRAEFFNLLNHANFMLPSNRVFSSAGQVLGAAGRISATSNDSRQIQFGLKLLF
ncbi:MAG: carboxypeptidase regulatory-like domain-containing protein [Acidobacteria bacterium]|nr:carboxypeptidase regulatory-like domain-containing protein [Acidobacteriota bacterium]